MLISYVSTLFVFLIPKLDIKMSSVKMQSDRFRNFLSALLLSIRIKMSSEKIRSDRFRNFPCTSAYCFLFLQILANVFVNPSFHHSGESMWRSTCLREDHCLRAARSVRRCTNPLYRVSSDWILHPFRDMMTGHWIQFISLFSGSVQHSQVALLTCTQLLCVRLS